MQDFAPFTPELFSPTTQKINDIPDNIELLRDVFHTEMMNKSNKANK
jgi:hypothetical protein